MWDSERTKVALLEIALEQRLSVHESGKPHCRSNSAGICVAEILDGCGFKPIDPPYRPLGVHVPG
jgi:hypothetical protein